MRSNNRTAPWVVSLTVGALLVGMTGFFACQTTGNASTTAGPPDINRFTTETLTEPGTLNEPMSFTFLNEKELLIAERRGGVKSFNVESRVVQTVGFVQVNTKYTSKEGQVREAEEGLIGIVAHPDFAQKPWVYMLYADPDTAKHVLARWEYRDGTLQSDSRTIMMSYPAQREVCCHTGGGMVFDKAGNLYITTGNNTANPPQGTSNLDERPGYETADDQRTAGNTNDLRGKILRIHPEDDGTYSIPEGNLFPVGTAKTRPEIYTMGHRNPWRISIDHQTGYIYWGEVGPDAGEDTELGPRGYDEFNRAKGPGFFGWPYFIGDNQPYADVDFESGAVGEFFDVNAPLNQSPNNTGLTELPAPQPALIWYPYAYSEEFPLLGSAGRNATGGPIFRQDDYPASDKRFPAYYDGKWLIVDFMRGWIMSVSLDENGDYKSMEPFLPAESFGSAIDITFSPEGDLFVLEYGSAWFMGNDNARIRRVQYNGGNRPPVSQAASDRTAGALPMTVQLSAEGTVDYDGDQIRYEWLVSSDKGFSQTLKGEKPSLTLEEAGVYKVQLTASDGKASSVETLELIAGNAPPEVDIQLTSGNQSFYFPGNQVGYTIKVQDTEDGSIADGQISREAVAVNFDYAPEGFDPIEIAQNHRASEEWVALSRGKTLIENSDCLSCHRVEVKSIGPSYLEVAEAYKNNPQEQAQLAGRIINGSVGRWGEHGMSAHPDLSPRDAQQMVDYIMGLGDQQQEVVVHPFEGTFTTEAPQKTNGRGGYLLRVAYTDKGATGLKPLSSEKIIALRNPKINPEHYDDAAGTLLMTTPGRSFNIVEHNGFLGYHELDLTGITEMVIGAEASKRNQAIGGIIEVHLDSVGGPLIGKTDTVTGVEIDFRAEFGKLMAAWEKGGKKGPEPSYWQVMNMFRPSYKVPIKEVRGIHNVYLVVKNPAAKTGQILVQMNDITFKQGTAPVQ